MHVCSCVRACAHARVCACVFMCVCVCVCIHVNIVAGESGAARQAILLTLSTIKIASILRIISMESTAWEVQFPKKKLE